MDGDQRSEVTVGSLVFTGILWLLSGYIALGALSFTFEARVAPLLFGGLGFLLLSFLLIRDGVRMWSSKKLDGQSDTATRSIGQGGAGEELAVDEVAAIGWVLANVLVLLVLGFVVGMALATFATVRVYAGERTVTAFALTAGVMGVLYFVFGQVLNTPLYPGLLGFFG